MNNRNIFANRYLTADKNWQEQNQERDKQTAKHKQKGGIEKKADILKNACEKNSNIQSNKDCEKRHNTARKANCEKNHSVCKTSDCEKMHKSREKHDRETLHRQNACPARCPLNKQHKDSVSRTPPRHTSRQIMDSPSTRLNKAIADRGICSRRKADILIFEGKVKINGIAAKEPGIRVYKTDIIEVNGKTLPCSCPLATVVINKPVHCVCTLEDPQNRNKITDFLPEDLKNLRLYPVGRLDYFSEGLIILTNDGFLAQRLCHPSFHLPRTYEVVIRGEITDAMLKIMKNGMTIKNGPENTRLMPVEAGIISQKNGICVLKLVLYQGINRQIRKMCDALGLTILKLKRIAIGNLKLGSLKSGECRKLDAKEIKELKKAAGLAE